ncbi:MAG TPA: ABC transporter permease [Vicinamibacterales bacterium]
MTRADLASRSLRHYWRSHLAVIAGVATAVAVLAGALLVGDSVRGSLRDLVLRRIGRADTAVLSSGFFREALAREIGGAPIVALQGTVTEQASGRRAFRVLVYGVDDRFWRFHGVSGVSGPAVEDAYLSQALTSDLGVEPGAQILVRVERPSAIPIESVHGRKEAPGRTIRLTARAALDAAHMGDFAIRPQQGSVRAVFIPLERVQHDLDRASRVNAILISDGGGPANGTVEAALKRAAELDDFGLRIRTLEPQRAIVLEADAGMLDARRAAAADRAAMSLGLRQTPVLTYLANALRSGDREVPYSLATAGDLLSISPGLRSGAVSSPFPIVINDWTARELEVHAGDPLSLEYYVWQEPGYLATKSAQFRIADIVPLAGAAADRDLTPVYPGITGAESFSDWDPPFPIDLKRVRRQDDDYWKQFRTTPKAFVPYAVGQALWGSARYGDRTSVRVYPRAGEDIADTARRFEAALRSALDPAAGGFTIVPVRQQGLAASTGSTDFGQYFVYFSFFLVVSAVVLAALFFRLGVEQRATEVGLLRAVGYTTREVRRLFTLEGLIVAVAGSVIGIAGAVGYGALMITGLRTWWSGAVGTRALTLHVSPLSLITGAVGAVATAVVCIWWSLRGLSRLSERDLLAGRIAAGRTAGDRSSALVAIAAFACAFAAAALVVLAMSGETDVAGAFFGAGAAVLLAGLCATAIALRRPPRRIEGSRWRGVLRIGLRNATQRPGRSVLAVAVIASAAFIVISIDAFRQGAVDPSDRKSGTGGYKLVVDLMLPLVHDPNSRDGREALGLSGRNDVTIVPFRVLPGDDASCLNLYEPVNPRILGAPRTFLDSDRFSFRESLAATADERNNPWLLLEHPRPDAAIPVAGDANSLTYVLHKNVGDELLLSSGGRTVRLAIVAALADSILQGELVMSEENFTRLFPEQAGYQFLLVDTKPADAVAVAAAIRNGASDYGAAPVPTAARLAEFHAVQNTYLSTFQTLGGLGLLVGTIGLAAVLLRNVLERRRELALLRAVGYGPVHVFTIVLGENALLLACGVALGAVAAAIAVGPAALQRGAHLPISVAGVTLLLAVLVAGLLSSALATRVAIRAPLVSALRSE